MSLRARLVQMIVTLFFWLLECGGRPTVSSSKLLGLSFACALICESWILVICITGRQLDCLQPMREAEKCNGEMHVRANIDGFRVVPVNQKQ